MIAPAWPIRRPGGAVLPAIKPTTGFLLRAAFRNAGLVDKNLNNERPRFLLLTSSDADQIEESAKEGIDGYLQKPFRREDIELLFEALPALKSGAANARERPAE